MPRSQAGEAWETRCHRGTAFLRGHVYVARVFAIGVESVPLHGTFTGLQSQQAGYMADNDQQAWIGCAWKTRLYFALQWWLLTVIGVVAAKR
jgi:hypothetical protein